MTQKVVFIWPGLLKNRRIKYVIDHDFPSPSGEYNLWFTERYYDEVLHDLIEIKLNNLIVDPQPGVPSDEAMQPSRGPRLTITQIRRCGS